MIHIGPILSGTDGYVCGFDGVDPGPKLNTYPNKLGSEAFLFRRDRSHMSNDKRILVRPSMTLSNPLGSM